MALEVAAKIKQKNNGTFKIADAVDIEYTNPKMDNVDNVKDAINFLHDTITRAPSISYIDEPGFREGEKKYWTIGDKMILKFNFESTAPGTCTVNIERNGILYKSVTMPKGNITIDLGAATAFASYTYKVSAYDSLGNQAIVKGYEESSTPITSITFNQISGGVNLQYNIENDIGKAVYSTGTKSEILVRNLSAAYPEAVKKGDNGEFFNAVNIRYTINEMNDDGTVGNQIFTEDVPYEENAITLSSYVINGNDGVVFNNIGEYKLTVQAFVHIDEENILMSSAVESVFAVLPTNSIAVTKITNFPDSIDTDSSLKISFRTITNVGSLSAVGGLSVQADIYMNYGTADQSAIKSIIIPTMTHGDVYTWNIGKLPSSGEGTYKCIIRPKPAGGGADTDYTIITIDETLKVAQSTSIGADYVHENLVCYFDANDMDNAEAHPEKWVQRDVSKNATKNFYYLKLHDFNYKTNGWIEDSVSSGGDGSKMLRFTGDTYAEMKYVTDTGDEIDYAPMVLMGDPTARGFAFEIVCRSRCIGEMLAKVASCTRSDVSNWGGIAVGYDSVLVSSTSREMKVPLTENQWNHIMIVADKNIRKMKGETLIGAGTAEITNKDIENLNPTPTLRIYINGCLTQCIAITDNEVFTDAAKSPMQLLLNAQWDNENAKVSNFGSSEIKLIRLYQQPLTSEQVLGNYINSFYAVDERTIEQNKNDANKANIPVVHFVRNKRKSADGKSYSFGKFSDDFTFADMHTITSKSSLPRNSKNTWVNCTMWYKYIDPITGEWKLMRYNDVDVYLQGTSTLLFPIKNYKIKLFNSEVDDIKRGKKLKIIPPNVTKADDWFVPDNTFTLKCDYMEHSHKNNTPTAHFFNELVNNIVSNENQLSPAKTIFGKEEVEVVDEAGNTTTVEKFTHRDGILGFPCLVYYNENNVKDEVSGNEIDYNEISTYDEVNNTGEYYENDGDVYVGSYMFNTDKSAISLGFEIDEDEEKDVTYTDENGTQVKAVDKDGKQIKRNIKGCVSLEGSTNSNLGAAAFMTIDDYHNIIYDDYLTPSYNDLLKGYDAESAPSYELFRNLVNGDRKTTTAGLSDLEKEIITWINDHVDTRYIMKQDEYLRSKNSEGDVIGFLKDDGTPDWNAYILATFEYRWNYIDEVIVDEEDDDGNKLYNIDEDLTNDICLAQIKRTILWLNEVQNDKDRFVKEFENYFSKEYCMAYYLQMMTFIQVDNAGKNAMFDCWTNADGTDGKIYPRPYDMDTQMCENNSGEDVIHIASEINPKLSPRSITGEFSGLADIIGYSDDPNHARYKGTFNTTDSKLWIAFGNYFKDDIIKQYADLRDKGIYTADNICNFVENITSDVIGQSFYNKDAAAKYLTQVKEVLDETTNTTKLDTSMLTRLQGNRNNRYREVIEKRFIFLDTFFSYAGTKGINQVIQLRTDVPNLGAGNTASFGISVYSPGYIQITVGTDCEATMYVDTDSSYEYAGVKYEGVLFTLPFNANNKDVRITGSGNIKAINHMNNLNISLIQLENASKLTDITITNSNNLKTLVVGNNPYLRNINIAGSRGVGTAGQSFLDCSICENLQTLNISNTKITSVTLPEGGSLKSFIATNCNLSAIEFKGLQFLTDINLDGCPNIISYTLDTCDAITDVALDSFDSLGSVTIINSNGVQSLNLNNSYLSELNISGCNALKKITMQSAKGSVLNTLRLNTVYGLEELDIRSAIPVVEGAEKYIDIILPYYANEEYANDENVRNAAINAGKDVRWHGLKIFRASQSAIRTIDYSVKATPTQEADFTPLTNLTTLAISNADKLKVVRGLQYKGTLSSLFNSCEALVSIYGSKFTATSSGIDSMFAYCQLLANVPVGSTVTATNNVFTTASGYSVTSASEIFRSCAKLSQTIMKNILSKYPNITSLSGAFRGCSLFGKLSSTFFSSNKKVKNLSLAWYGTTGFTGFNAGAFDPLTELTSIQAMCSGDTGITAIPVGLFNKNTKITNCESAFRGCTGLTRANVFTATNGYKLFPDGNAVTNIRAMFQGCTKLAMGPDISMNVTNPDTGVTSIVISTPKDFFKNLVNITDAVATFDNSGWTESIPEGILENNTLLKNITGLFANNANITGDIPNSLFYTKNDTNSNVPTGTTHSALTRMEGVFYNDSKLGGIISKDFFKGVENVTSIGATTDNDLTTTGPQYLYYGGMFGNTAINGYFHEFMKPLTEVTNISLLFFKGATNGSTISSIGRTDAIKEALAYVYFGDSSRLGTGSIYSGIFKYNTKIVNAKYVFAGNEGIQGFFGDYNVDTGLAPNIENPDLFVGKTVIKYLEGIFAGCKELTAPAYKTMFKGMSNLITVKNAFAGCTNLSDQLAGDMFQGCVKLENTAQMFLNCENLGTTGDVYDISIPAELFEDCRGSLVNTSYMFRYCGFKGRIGTGTADVNINTWNDLYYRLSDGTYYDEKGNFFKANGESVPSKNITVAKLQEYINDGTVTEEQGPEQTEVTINVTQRGLLAECLRLVSVRGMFQGCRYLKGAIPQDMFYTDSTTKIYNRLTDMSYLFDNCNMLGLKYDTIHGWNPQVVYYDVDQDEPYFIPNNWMIRCTSVTTLFAMFRRTASVPNQYPDANAYYYGAADGVDVNKKTLPKLIIGEGTFAGQLNVTDISWLFAMNYSLGGSYTNQLFSTLQKLTDAQYTFFYCNKIESFGSTLTNAVFLPISATSKNNKLKNMYAAFYACTGINQNSYIAPLSRFSVLNTYTGMVGGGTVNRLANKNTFLNTLADDSFSVDNSSYAGSVNDVTITSLAGMSLLL